MQVAGYDAIVPPPPFPEGEPGFVNELKQYDVRAPHWDVTGKIPAESLALAGQWCVERSFPDPDRLLDTAAANPQKLLSNTPLLPGRLWEQLLLRAGLRQDLHWAELGSKGLNRLTATLTADAYPLSGKSKFREEFVTAGGVALSNLNLNTLESKQYPGLFFAGEVLDVDAITGGFNLQAAWSTGYVCAHSIARSL